MTHIGKKPSLDTDLCCLFGGYFGNDNYLMMFSARLDEAGTDGKSAYTVVGGAVSTVDAWEKLEGSWDRLLGTGIPFHWAEFEDRDGPFKGWSDFKRKRFIERQEKIIKRNTVFRISVGVESRTHAAIKKDMQGIKGFHADSDYSLCLRWLMFHTSEQLMKIDPDHRLRILVEDGPWAVGAASTYQRVAAMTAKRKPAKHAHRLAGFASAPKGEYRSLEMADYVAGTEHQWMSSEGRKRPREASRLSVLLTKDILQDWYDGMIAEKENRRAFDRAKKAVSA